MSSQANIVINDGAGTPVAHTFNPKGARKQPSGSDVAVWRDQTPANAEGFLSITEHHSEAVGQGNEKFTWVIEVPTLETVGTNDAGVTPPQTRAYAVVGVLEFRFPKRATLLELQHIAAYMKNFSALAYVTNAVTLREPAW